MSTPPATTGKPGEPLFPTRTSTAHAFASGLCLRMGLLMGGAAIGVAVGMPMDRMGAPAHGFSGVLGLVLGGPVGGTLGLMLGEYLVRRLSPDQRFRSGIVGFAVAAACVLGMYGAVKLGLMRW